MNSSQEIADEFVVSGGDAAELFETIEHALDPVAIFITLEVAFDGQLAIGLGWDDRQDAFNQQTGSHIVSVVTLVSEHRLRFGNRHVEQFRDCKIVGGFAACQDKA